MGYKAKNPRGKASYIPEHHMELALSRCTSPIHALRDQALLLVSYNCGLRAKEIAALKLKDIFNHEGKLVDTLCLKKTKGDKPREVPLTNPRTRAALWSYIEWRRSVSWLGGNDAPLFRSQKGSHFSPNSLQRHFHNMYERASLKGSSHSGRRSFATRLIERGADIYSVMQLMGHSSINTTQEYFSTSPERLRSVVRLLD